MPRQYASRSWQCDPLPEVTYFNETCQENEIPLYVIRSKSGNGYHSYIFFDSHVPAWKARLVSYALLQRAGISLNDSSFDNFFPAQDQTRNYGNCIAFPFQGEASLHGHTLFLNPETGFSEPYPNQWEILAGIQKIEESFLDNLICQWRLERHQSSNTQCGAREPGWVGRALRGVGEHGAKKATGHDSNKAFERYCQYQDDDTFEMVRIVAEMKGKMINFEHKRQK